jgi:uncharacterized repeat protein (TIGR02543 family)
MQKEIFIAVILAIYFLTCPVVAADAITLGQIDEFNTDTQNWRSGNHNPSPPQRIPNGGPDGAGDGYLELSSTGVGNAGSKLVVFNTSQWTGDWTGEGVNTIEMDLNNLGATDLVMRLSINGSGGLFSLQEGIPLSAGSGWQHVVFYVRADDFTSVGGTNIDDTLANVSVLRLLHNPVPNWVGTKIAATLGADNITASQTFNLNVNPVGNGNVNRNPDGSTYNTGTGVELTAVPDTGWAFSGWSGDLGGSNNPENIIMDSDKNITATFEGLNDYDLLVTIEGSGTVSLNPPGGSYYDGENVTLTATADPYWEFNGWSGHLSGSNNPKSIVIDSDKNITATFSLKDSDDDGVTDQEEDAGPNGGDGNDDGIADYNQTHVASFKAYDGLHDVTIESPTGTTLSACSAQGNPHPEDSPWWVDFPYGFFEFSIAGLAPGGTAIANLYIHDGDEQNTYYKYGPTPDNPHNDQWYKFKFDTQTQTGAEFNGNIITLHFVDGQLGDDDLTANGTILDVGGPGVVDSGSGDSTSGGPSSGGSGRSGGSTGGPLGGCFITTLANGSGK